MTSIDSHVSSFLIYSFHRCLPYPFCGPGRISEGSVLIPAVGWSTVTYFCFLWGIHPSLLAWVCLNACGCVQHGCTDPSTWSQWKNTDYPKAILKNGWEDGYQAHTVAHSLVPVSSTQVLHKWVQNINLLWSAVGWSGACLASFLFDVAINIWS